MPVEIRELVIRAVVKDGLDAAQEKEADAGEQQDNQAIIEACVKQVLKILHRKQGR